MKVYLINKFLFSSYLFSIILWNFSLFSQSILPTFHGSLVNTAVSNQLPPEAAHAGAGGGSSYIGGVSGGCTISGLKTGHGQIIISW